VTTSDSEGRSTVYDLPAFNPKNHRNSLPRLMNVGRLDINSEGLLLFSSDGPLAQALMSPQIGLDRIYRVRVHGRLSEGQIINLAKGVTSNGIHYRGATVMEEKDPTGRNTWYRIVLNEGKNREIRKLMEHFGCVVNRLIRGGLRLLRQAGLSGVSAAEVTYRLDHEQFGQEYGRPTPAILEAVRLAAEEAGLKLEHTYTGKALAGLFADSGRQSAGPVLFVNTFNSRPLAPLIPKGFGPAQLPDDYQRFFSGPVEV